MCLGCVCGGLCAIVAGMRCVFVGVVVSLALCVHEFACVVVCVCVCDCLSAALLGCCI